MQRGDPCNMEETTLTTETTLPNGTAWFHLDLSEREVKRITISADDLKNVLSISFRFCLCYVQTCTNWKPGENFDSADFVQELPLTWCRIHTHNVGLVFILKTDCDDNTVHSRTYSKKSKHCGKCGWCDHYYDDCEVCSLGEGHCKYKEQDPCEGSSYEVIEYTWTIRYTGTRYKEHTAPFPLVNIIEFPLLRLGEDSYNMLVRGGHYECVYPLLVADPGDHIDLACVKKYYQKYFGKCLTTLDEHHQYFKTRERWRTESPPSIQLLR